MRANVREALIAVGVTGDQLAALEAKYPSRRQAKVNYENGCPACGREPQNYDYACGACSDLQAAKPRRFWQFAFERAAGTGAGRPVIVPERRGDVLRHEFTFGAPEPVPVVDRPRFEWLITVGLAGRVVVAAWRSDAVRVAKALEGVAENAGHAILCLGPTDKPETIIPKNFEEGE